MANVKAIAAAATKAGLTSGEQFVAFALGFAAASKAKVGKVTLYNNIICPFAQRAVLALLEKKVPYDEVKIPLTGEMKRVESGEPSAAWEGKTHADLVAIKEDYKKTINATGEVPTLKIGDQIVTESDVVSEFLDDAFPESGARLFPKDPFQRARIRGVVKTLSGGNGVMNLYQFVRNQDPTKDAEKLAKLYKFLAVFAAKASPEGPFFLGKEPCYLDILFMPFYYRFNLLLSHYRKAEFIPSDAKAYPWAPRMQRWAAAVEARESYKKSIPSKDVVIAAYTGYAGDRGISVAFGK